MIHIAIGTKAQFIKMAPIMRELFNRGINYNLIDLGQHALITADLRKEFDLKEPDVCLSRGKNVSSLVIGLVWMIKLLVKGLNRTWLQKIFINQSGVCLIHGDTISTLIALYLAKQAGLKVAHVEAGLRSFNLLQPFPEELLRIIVMKFSDILFVPSLWAGDNLKKMGLEKKTVLTNGNTSYEAVNYSLAKPIQLGLNIERFALITMHRMENIFSRQRLVLMIELIEKLAEKLPVVFVGHQPTINQLNKFNLLARLEKINNVHFFKILFYAHFIHLLNSCELVITDGGSIQEESFYLNKPCLLLRAVTERQEGLGQNVLLSGFIDEQINFFLDNYKRFCRNNQELKIKNVKPANEIVDFLIKNGFLGDNKK
jgi:UDP-N-acetylglucosamine 2-epimerase